MDTKKGALTELKESLGYLFQSIQGRYSMESYLDILGEFTDEQINIALDSGYIYRGGELTFSTDPDQDVVKASVTMRFYDKDSNKDITKKAERQLKKKTFTSEAIKYLEDNTEVTYEIKPPRRD